MYEGEYAVTSLCLSALEEEPEVPVRCCVTTEQVVGAWEQCLLTEVCWCSFCATRSQNMHQKNMGPKFCNVLDEQSGVEGFVCLFVCFRRDSPQWAMAPPSRGF